MPTTLSHMGTVIAPDRIGHEQVFQGEQGRDTSANRRRTAHRSRAAAGWPSSRGCPASRMPPLVTDAAYPATPSSLPTKRSSTCPATPWTSFSARDQHFMNGAGPRPEAIRSLRVPSAEAPLSPSGAELFPFSFLFGMLTITGPVGVGTWMRAPSTASFKLIGSSARYRRHRD